MEETIAIRDGKSGLRGHEVSAVDECEAFFRFELDRLCTDLRQYIFGWDDFTRVDAFALADECEREMSQWRKVARCAN